VLGAIATLLLFQLAGEALTVLLHLPIPGPVLGMGLLFVALVLRRSVPRGLTVTAQALLRHLSLLFVPAAVGVMLHFERIAREWPAIVAALVVSTFVAIVVTAVVLGALMRGRQEQP
jgi:holin-like protein